MDEGLKPCLSTAKIHPPRICGRTPRVTGLTWPLSSWITLSIVDGDWGKILAAERKIGMRVQYYAIGPLEEIGPRGQALEPVVDRDVLHGQEYQREAGKLQWKLSHRSVPLPVTSDSPDHIVCLQVERG